MDLQIDCKRVRISANNGRYVSVSIDSVDASDILNHFSINEILEHFSQNDILEKIGQDKAEQFWDLIPNE